jgi:hypothetical protein
MNNLFNQFQSLVGTNRTEIVNITANNSDGTSNATTLSGVNLVVKGDSVSAGNRAIIENGNVIGAAPNGTITEVFV